MSAGPQVRALTGLAEGQEIPFGGDRVTVSVSRNSRRRSVPATGSSSCSPPGRCCTSRGRRRRSPRSSGSPSEAFAALAGCSDDADHRLLRSFRDRARRRRHVRADRCRQRRRRRAAADRGRSTTRLVLDEAMRRSMIEGLLGWRDSREPSRRPRRSRRTRAWDGRGRRAPLGVVGFVFEGRPNVFADACGVVRTGNAVVFRIGSDALGTARAIVRHALQPAVPAPASPTAPFASSTRRLTPPGTRSVRRSRLALAVARGSGTAVAELGRGRLAGRDAGEPARHRWGLDGRRSAPPQVADRRRRALARPQGVQHVQRVRGPAPARRRTGAGGARRARRGGRAPRHPARLHVVAGGEDVRAVRAGSNAPSDRTGGGTEPRTGGVDDSTSTLSASSGSGSSRPR
jgi:hypothetical protein